MRADNERERDEILARLTDTASRLAEVTRAHAAELERARADAARERDELRAALESRAQVLEESRGELRGRAERAERDLDAARAELARARQESGTTDAPAPPAAAGRSGAGVAQEQDTRPGQGDGRAGVPCARQRWLETRPPAQIQPSATHPKVPAADRRPSRAPLQAAAASGSASPSRSNHS